MYGPDQNAIETVRIVDADCEGGFKIINKADLSPDDVLFDKADAPKGKAKSDAA